MRPERAEEIGRDALLWLLGREDDLARLLALSGLAATDLRRRARDPEFLGFVLDFVLTDEERAGEFARAEGLTPEAALRARATLPGGDAPHWT